MDLSSYTWLHAVEDRGTLTSLGMQTPLQGLPRMRPRPACQKWSVCSPSCYLVQTASPHIKLKEVVTIATWHSNDVSGVHNYAETTPKVSIHYTYRVLRPRMYCCRPTLTQHHQRRAMYQTSDKSITLCLHAASRVLSRYSSMKYRRQPEQCVCSLAGDTRRSAASILLNTQSQNPRTHHVPWVSGEEIGLRRPLFAQYVEQFRMQLLHQFLECFELLF